MSWGLASLAVVVESSAIKVDSAGVSGKLIVFMELGLFALTPVMKNWLAGFASLSLCQRAFWKTGATLR